MKKSMHYVALIVFGVLMVNCKSEPKKDRIPQEEKTEIEKSTPVIDYTVLSEKPEGVAAPKGMVWVPGAVFKQGAVNNDKIAMANLWSKLEYTKIFSQWY